MHEMHKRHKNPLWKGRWSLMSDAMLVHRPVSRSRPWLPIDDTITWQGQRQPTWGRITLGGRARPDRPQIRPAPRADSASFTHHLGPRHRFDRVLLVSGDRDSEVRFL